MYMQQDMHRRAPPRLGRPPVVILAMNVSLGHIELPWRHIHRPGAGPRAGGWQSRGL